MAEGPSPEVHRGFRNLAGQNNCFLNSALQLLWHLPKFRRALAEVPPTTAADADLLPALQSLFASYQYGDDQVLPADEVRRVLSSNFAGTGHFKMGDLDDAVECLEAILKTLHCEAVGTPLDEGGDEKTCHPSCPACEVFKVSYFDQLKCSKCPATSEPKYENDFTYRVYVAECIAPGIVKGEGFQRVLRQMWQTANDPKQLPLSSDRADQRGCPEADEQLRCRMGCAIPQRWCLQSPEVLTCNLVWHSGRPPVADIRRIFRLLRCSIDLAQVFTVPGDGDHSGSEELSEGRTAAPKMSPANGSTSSQIYRFCGMICYYGKHYVSLFARRNFKPDSSGHGEWLLFDDATIRVLESWAAVKEYCIAARYQPTVVWFEKVPEGEAPWWADDEDDSLGGVDDDEGKDGGLSWLPSFNIFGGGDNSSRRSNASPPKRNEEAASTSTPKAPLPVSRVGLRSSATTSSMGSSRTDERRDSGGVGAAKRAVVARRSTRGQRWQQQQERRIKSSFMEDVYPDRQGSQDKAIDNVDDMNMNLGREDLGLSRSIDSVDLPSSRSTGPSSPPYSSAVARASSEAPRSRDKDGVYLFR